MFRLDLTKSIEVKTGDYKQKWTDAKIINIGVNVYQFDDSCAWTEMNADIEFTEGEDKGNTQYIYDLERSYDKEWRYKEKIKDCFSCRES